MKQPQSWTDQGMSWDALPVLAVPSRHGWAVYEAIRERIAYLYGADWPDDDDLPSALLPMAEAFNPNQDYKIVERRMHDAVTELIPHFKNWTDDAGRLWREAELLEALGEESRLEPNPYFLSAAWLYQMYRIINYLRRRDDIISLTWIDEADPVYYSNIPEVETIYDADRAFFEQEIGFKVAVIQPGGARSGEIFGRSGPPDNVLYYECPRDPCDSMADFIAAFEALTAQYAATRYTIGLFVDSSGSMSLSTIHPAYGLFVEWLQVNHPRSRIVERTAGDERWLAWTAQYIAELTFRFEFKEEEAEKDNFHLL